MAKLTKTPPPEAKAKVAKVDTTEVITETPAIAAEVAEVDTTEAGTENHSTDKVAEVVETTEVGTENHSTDEVDEAIELETVMKPYLDFYPTHNEFFRTSDGQVFLAENLAVLHAKSLDGDNKFKTYKRK